jgi:hypothetical protein
MEESSGRIGWAGGGVTPFPPGFHGVSRGTRMTVRVPFSSSRVTCWFITLMLMRIQGVIVTSSASCQRGIFIWYSSSSAFRCSHDAPQMQWHHTLNIYLNYLTLFIC